MITTVLVDVNNHGPSRPVRFGEFPSTVAGPLRKRWRNTVIRSNQVGGGDGGYCEQRKGG